VVRFDAGLNLILSICKKYILFAFASNLQNLILMVIYACLLFFL
jgi:hypothetical protein